MNSFFSLLQTLKIPEIIGCLIAITVKESSKAFISSKLEDPMPKRDGRVTLNPIKHIEPIGLILMIIYGYGWGKIVETTSLYYKNKKRDTIITHLVPIIINIVVGLIFYWFLYRIYILSNSLNNNSKILNFVALLYIILSKVTIMNFRYAIVNLVPISPFEGSKILKLFLKPNYIIKLASREKLYLMIFVILILMGFAGEIFDFILRVLTLNLKLNF